MNKIRRMYEKRENSDIFKGMVSVERVCNGMMTRECQENGGLSSA